MGQRRQVAERRADRRRLADRPHHLGQDARGWRTQRPFVGILDVDDVRFAGERALGFLGGDDADEQLHAAARAVPSRATKAPRRSKSTTRTSVSAPTAARSSVGHVGGARTAVDDPVDRRTPRALSDRSDPECQQRVDDRSRPWMKHATLTGGEHRSDLALDLGERGAEFVDVRGHHAREQPRQQEPRHGRLTRRVYVQLIEESLLRIAGQSLRAERQREHAAPPLRHRMTSDKRADRASVRYAGLDHEARCRERPATDAGPCSPPGRVRKLLGGCRNAR